MTLCACHSVKPSHSVLKTTKDTHTDNGVLCSQAVTHAQPSSAPYQHHHRSPVHRSTRRTRRLPVCGFPAGPAARVHRYPRNSDLRRITRISICWNIRRRTHRLPTMHRVYRRLPQVKRRFQGVFTWFTPEGEHLEHKGLDLRHNAPRPPPSHNIQQNINGY